MMAHETIVIIAALAIASARLLYLTWWKGR